jgi:hypothetical protein
MKAGSSTNWTGSKVYETIKYAPARLREPEQETLQKEPALHAIWPLQDLNGSRMKMRTIV